MQNCPVFVLLAVLYEISTGKVFKQQRTIEELVEEPQWRTIALPQEQSARPTFQPCHRLSNRNENSKTEAGREALGTSSSVHWAFNPRWRRRNSPTMEDMKHSLRAYVLAFCYAFLLIWKNSSYGPYGSFCGRLLTTQTRKLCPH